jgi:hypothetical protein
VRVCRLCQLGADGVAQRYVAILHATAHCREIGGDGRFEYAHILLAGQSVMQVTQRGLGLGDCRNQVVQFTPRTAEPMLVACLWSYWIGPAGK